MKKINFVSLAMCLSLVASCTENAPFSALTDTNNITADTEDPAPDEGGASAEPDADKDIGTPGSGADAGKADECNTDEDCKSPVECGMARCIPGTKGNVCAVFARLQPKNFCDDGDPCTIDNCNTDPQSAKDFEDFGCNHKPRGCDDGNPCTLNLCSPDAPDGCVYPTDVNACNDNNACTQDSCLPGGNCEHAPVACDDGIASTEDGCTAAGGCYHNPSECAGDGECSDNDPCTIDWCNADQNCIHQPMACNDGIACTNDVCFGGACMAISNCMGGDACNESVCNILSGSCEPQGIEKPDGKECTADICDPTSGWSYHKIDGCCVKDSDCEIGDACIVPVCDTTLNICASVPKLVDDGIACTIDSCELSGYIQNKADDSFCVGVPGKPHCSTEFGCVACTEYAHCDDNDPCTDDNCEWKTGECTHKAKCEAPKVCNYDDEYSWCEFPKGWCNEDSECGYKGPCNKGTCTDNFCQYSPISCDDQNPCTEDSCSSFGCQHEWKDCNDNDPCTDMDSCDTTTGVCQHMKDAFCIQCTLDKDCAQGPVCAGNSVVDYSGVCHEGECFHSYPEICGSSACYDGYCQDGACLQKVKTCDDGDACSKDFCDYMQGCTSAQIDCDDYDPCTKDSCDLTSGCVNDWDYTSCPSGPESTLCGNLWNCGPCKEVACDDGLKQTSDLCIGPPNYACVHGIPGLFGGIGIVNLGSTAILVDLKPNNWPPAQNLKLDPGDHLYYLDATSVEVHSVIDPATQDDLGIPPSMPCVDWNGNLNKGKVTDNTLTCD